MCGDVQVWPEQEELFFFTIAVYEKGYGSYYEYWEFRPDVRLPYNSGHETVFCTWERYGNVLECTVHTKNYRDAYDVTSVDVSRDPTGAFFMNEFDSLYHKFKIDITRLEEMNDILINWDVDKKPTYTPLTLNIHQTNGILYRDYELQLEKGKTPTLPDGMTVDFDAETMFLRIPPIESTDTYVNYESHADSHITCGYASTLQKFTVVLPKEAFLEGHEESNKIDIIYDHEDAAGTINLWIYAALSSDSHEVYTPMWGPDKYPSLKYGDLPSSESHYTSYYDQSNGDLVVKIKRDYTYQGKTLSYYNTTGYVAEPRIKIRNETGEYVCSIHIPKVVFGSARVNPCLYGPSYTAF